MHIETFSSQEEMFEFLRKRTEEAHKNLADPQRAITFGDTWVRYIDHEMFEFGRVFTPEEIALDSLNGGESWDEVIAYIAHVGNRFAEGFMTGIAYSGLSTDGELGETHKASVWPIERRLFDAAGAVGWDVTRLDGDMLMLLRIAMAQHHTHDVTLTARQEQP